ncbi:MAG: hypothetical protein JWM76_4543 [Pseudonocardiales bacterium]|nr:hypothetical protein [Pseudonocardiales bacterium]
MLEIVVLVLAITVAVWWPLQAYRGPRGGKFAGAMRTPTGSTAPALPKWRHGTITMNGPGEFVFRPGGPIGMRAPKGQPVDMRYSHVSAAAGKVGWSHAWSMNPLLQVAQLTTSKGDAIELAASAKSLAAMRNRTT